METPLSVDYVVFFRMSICERSHSHDTHGGWEVVCVCHSDRTWLEAEKWVVCVTCVLCEWLRSQILTTDRKPPVAERNHVIYG